MKINIYPYIATLALFINTVLAECPDTESCEDKCECAWHFQQEILFWTAYEDGLQFTNKPSDVLTTSDFTTTRTVDPSFNWEYGTRLKFGYTVPCTPWTFYLSWTYMPSKATGNKSVNSDSPDFEGFFPIWSMSPDTLPGDYVSSASSRWHLHTNIIDLDSQYSLCFCDRLTVSPLFGLRCAILHQKLHVKYTGGSFFNGFDDNSMRNRFTGGGPRFGITGNYYLCRGFSIVGLAAITPMYGHYDISHCESYLNETRFEEHHTENRLAMSYDYQIGMQWKGKALESLPNMVLSFAWEGHLFTNQNRLFRGNYGFFRTNRDLLLQGVTLSASFCF